MAKKPRAVKPAKKPAPLGDELVRIQSLFAQLTISWPVQRMSQRDLVEIERLSQAGNNLMQQLERELRKAFSKIKQPQDHQPIADAYAIYAEAQVALLFGGRAVNLERTPGTGGQRQKRPDFVFKAGRELLYFEVKCLDFEGGINSHIRIANDAFEVQLDLDDRAQSSGVHIGAMEISPFANTRGVTDRLEVLIDKIVGNIKSGQITYGPTVLVIEMGRIQADAHDPSSLTPVYYIHDYPGPACVSGELWQIALGRRGDQIYKLPDFEGQTNLDRLLEKDGVLRQFPELSAITFVVPGLSTPAKVYTIWNPEPKKFESISRGSISTQVVGNLVHQYSDAWNDTTNIHGFKYSLHQ
jgi:hypothetical protein